MPALPTNPGGPVPPHTGNTSDLLPGLSDASSAVFLLKDYSRFGLAERICYHFDLTEALVASASVSTLYNAAGPSGKDDARRHDGQSESGPGAQGDKAEGGPSPVVDAAAPPSACGVVRILEMAPVAAPMAISHRVSKRHLVRQKRFLRRKLREFNERARAFHSGEAAAAAGGTLCYRPQDLPLRCNPSTKVLFGYEKTRIAFCVDASASMTSLFGVNGSRNAGRRRGGSRHGLCPLDRLPEMARIFFRSLVEPIGSTPAQAPWRPLVHVTVLAVYPMGKTSETSLLVRDYLVRDVESADKLADRIERWTHTEVESGISERLSRRRPANTWSVPIYSSNLRHVLEAGDYALDVLSSEARPVIVVATDGRSISCEGIVDVVPDISRVDIPVHVLDVSLTETHTMEEDDASPMSKQEINFLTYDPGGNMGFPLYLTDDSEALFVVCRATGGCFLDLSLLSEAAKSTAGQQQLADELVQQSYSFKRRFVKMNGLQWLTLFSMSPISPTFNSSWGKLLPPSYLQKQLSKSMVEGTASATIQPSYASDALEVFRHQNSARQTIASDPSITTSSGRRQHAQSRTTFSTYVVSPVRIKALILARIKEGYRAKQYGLSTNDPDKVFIQFTLPLESGTILHYELSYKSLSPENHMVGSAHVKVELSGDPGFVQAVKNDFLHQLSQAQEQRSFTVRQKRSERLCQVIRGMRRGDLLQSYLKPPSNWDNILANPGSPFVKRLGTLKSIERKRHFQADQLDVVCTGTIPYGIDDKFLSGFTTNQDGRRELIDAITDWSSQTMTKGSKFLKRAPNSGTMTNYCVVEIIESTKASQLFTMDIEFFGGTDPIQRFETLSSLKTTINRLKNVEVLGKQIAPFLIGNNKNAFLKNDVQIQFHHASWDLVKDSELLSLLSKRRTEIGGFRLLESRDDYALFAKLASKTLDSPGDLVQYEIAVHAEKVVIDLYMESESGVFNPYYAIGGRDMSKFGKMVNVIRRRDQECGRALKSRTTLLRAFEEPVENQGMEEDHELCVKRLLAYSSRVTRKLRFFRLFGEVNSILVELTSELLLSKMFGVKSARLRVDPRVLIRDEEPGVWFILEYDRQTMSMIHLSLVDNAETNESIQTIRELTFFTIGISDLYSKRDDLADDDSAESHISEYLCVSDFADRFEVEQVKNFALAAYLALRQASNAEDAKIHRADFDEVIKSLQFVEVSSFLVTGAKLDNTEEYSKLLRSITTILSPVPGDQYHFYYSGHSKIDILEVGENESGDSSGDDSVNSGEDINSIDFVAPKVGEFVLSKNDHSVEGNDAVCMNKQGSLNPPIFVRFHLDGKLATMEDLNRITESSMLTVTVSIFGSDEDGSDDSPSIQLPVSHQTFALEIGTLLRSYIAEQTLERIQNINYSDESLQLVRKCMAKIRSVVSFVIEIYFFISQRNMMMPAAAPAGGEAEVEEGLHILEIDLVNNGHFILRPLNDGVYFLSRIVEDDAPLQFWCLLKLQRSNGTISSQIYHPEGEEVAMSAMAHIHGVVCSCINLVNQQLLLRSMHRTRTVSELLIPNSTQQSAGLADTEIERIASDTFVPGIFQCPIVYRKLFGLYHRAATNPGQVARTLEATVLHNFAVSNRPGIFVYKDETGAIFYMKLEPRGSGIDSDGHVELLVYGIKKPGPSVTEQLRVLLQRRLLHIGVDMLSSVLTKNPHFKWKQADFLFLRSFDSEWKKLEKEKVNEGNGHYYYKFPCKVYDPCMVLLFFRQNLCGTTFFHRLNDISQDGSSPSPTIGLDGMLTSGGTTLNMNDHEFSLYFNNAPSKLDPAFQGFNTLTEKGEDYCRKIGPGIAIVEFTLIDGKGNSLNKLHFAEPANESSSFPELPLSDIRMRCFAERPSDSLDDSVYVRIRITDTALKREILNQWILLTFNQALIAWVTERMLERSFYGLLRPVKDCSINKLDMKRKVLVDKLCPGLPTINTILESSYNLPHAAIQRYENSGVIRSSMVATLTLDLLENCILKPLVEKKMITIVDGGDDWSKCSLSEKFNLNLCVIRLSRSEKPHIAHLKWNASGRKKAAVSISSKNGISRPVEDSPVDCPEYICFFTVAERDRNIKGIDSQLRLYREVVIHDGISEKSESIDLLESVRGKSPRAFLRSFSFIFSVKRNSRRLWTYNWNPKLVKSVKTLIHEVEASNLADTSRESSILQRRLLGALSPGLVEATSKKNTQQKIQHISPVSEISSSQGKEKKSSIETSTDGPTRRIRRPTMIRRPKLIGKSVEGAAMQAMAASRKRASTNQFKNITNPSAGTKAPSRLQVNQNSRNARGNLAGKTQSNSIRSQRRASRIQEEERDETLSRVLNDYFRLCSRPQAQLRRLSLIQSQARSQLADIWWPQSQSQTIPKSVAEFLISVAPNAWNDVCALPPLPGGVFDVFIPTLARWVVALTPGLELLPVSLSLNQVTKRVDSLLLCSKIRNVRGSKCCAITRISVVGRKSTKQGLSLVRSEGWVLNLRRRSKSSKIANKRRKVRSSYLTEKDSAAMDKLLKDVHHSLFLQSLLFDFSASMVERAVRLLDERIHFNDLVPTVQELTRRYSYGKQKRMPMLNHRAFEATIVLKSYNDRLIDMFDAKILFERLCIEAEDREMLRCGNSLCLKSISMKGSHSMCFITLHPEDAKKMKLVILSRTQGLDLADFMFREGSNVAIHILDNIAIEGSRLALKELHFVAECLLKDSLWKSFSSRRSPHTSFQSTIHKMPQQQNLDELLRLVPSHPFLQLPMSGSFRIDRINPDISFLFDKESGINWLSCCSSMKQNKFFSPHSYTEERGFINNLFYMESYDVFLMIVVKRDASLLRIDVIEKKRAPDKYHLIFDSVVNFILHFVWYNL